MRKIYYALGAVLSMAAFNFSTAQGETCATATPAINGLNAAAGVQGGAGGGASNGCFGGGATDSYWYTFTAPCDGNLFIESDASGTPDTRLSVYNGDCAALNCLASDDDGGDGFSSQLTTAVTGGVTYFIEWDDRWNNAGNFDWNLVWTPTIATVNFTNAGITSSSFGLTWDNIPGATGYTVEYGVSGFVQGSGTVVSGWATESYIATGLTPEVTYDLYVTPEGTGCSASYGPYSATTLPLCAIPQNLTWNLVGSSTDSVVFEWDAGASMETNWNFEWGSDGFALGSGNAVALTDDSLMLTSTDGVMANTVYEYYLQSNCGVDTVSYFIGPIEFTTGTSCPAPANLAATADGTSAVLSWDENGSASSWNIEYGVSGFSLGVNGTALNGATSNAATPLTGLTPNTSYEYYVQAACGAGDNSTWVGPLSFTTTIVCVDPTVGTISGLTETGATLNWNAGGTETSWNVEYGATGFTPGDGSATTVNAVPTNTLPLTGLTNNTTYEYYIQGICGMGADSLSGWAGPFSFTTITICATPTNLDAINISFTSANVLWQAGTSETSWNVEWGLAGFEQGSTSALGTDVHVDMVAPVNPYYVTGLTASTPYEFYVQAVCGSTADSLSQWVGPFSFATQLQNDASCNALTLPVDGSSNLFTNATATVAAGETAAAPAAGDVNGTTTFGDGAQLDNTVWFKFVAPAGGAVEVSTVDTTISNFTEIAVYEAGDCNNFNTFSLLAANSNASGTGTNIDPVTAAKGAKVEVCGLTAGNEYFVMVDSYTQNAGTFGFPVGVALFEGPFKISISALEEAVAGNAVAYAVCAGSAVDLFNSVTGQSSNEGTWYNNGNIVSSEFSSISLATGNYPFDYIVGGVCGSDTVSTILNISVPPSAGGDGTLDGCNTTTLVLVNALNGNNLELGGDWIDVDGTNQLVNGVLNANGMTPGVYNFDYVVAGNGACDADTASFQVTINDCAGLEDLETSNFSIFPNPSNGEVTLTTTLTETYSVEVRDLNGKVVYTINDVNDQSVKMNLSNLETGMYIANVISNEKVSTLRLIIK